MLHNATLSQCGKGRGYQAIYSATAFLVALLIGTLGFGQGSAQADAAAKIQQVGSPRIHIAPDGRLEITLSFQVLGADGQPIRELPASEGIIYEDGKEVHRFRPQSLIEQDREVILVLDTSGSMVGTHERPLDRLDKAKQAAELFINQLDPRTPCGLVLFHHEPYSRVPLSRQDRSELLRAIRQAKGAGGTAYLDAALVAMRFFSETGNKGRALVLLTDGRDVNSKGTLAEVVEHAQKQAVNVYTIGLGKPGANLHVRSLLILDRSGSMKQGNKIGYLRQAARRFVELMPPDHADCSLLPFDHEYNKPLEPTSDRRLLIERIQSLTPRGGTSLFDVTLFGLEWLASETLALAKAPAGVRECRRVIVLLTDGINESGRITNKRQFFHELATLHKTAQIPIFVIGLGDPKHGEIDESVLRGIAETTGGRYYGVANPAHLQEVFEQLSIDIHDEGIDEAGLRELAEKTGGRYFHAAEADQLAREFNRALEQIQTTFTITYLSPRRRQDGTPSRIEIRWGHLLGQAGYRTHGVVTPAVDMRVFFILLGSLVVLGVLPIWWQRLRRAPSP